MRKVLVFDLFLITNPLAFVRFQAIDQRLSDVLQSSISLIAGVSIAVYFGWNVASVGITTSLIIGLLQTFMSSYLKRRVMQDMVLSEEVSRVYNKTKKPYFNH